MGADKLSSFMRVGVRPVFNLELIGDNRLRIGFSEKMRGKNKKGRNILFVPSEKKTVWNVAQWYSKSSIFNRAYQSIGEDRFVYEDKYKTFHVRSKKYDCDLVMGVNAKSEYDGVYKGKDDPWPHLLVNQRISFPRGHLGKKSPSLVKLKQVKFHIKVRLLHHEANRKEGYTPKTHAAQFTIFLTIQNLNKSNEGFGNYYWFGIKLFDDRYPVTSLRMKFDRGRKNKPGTGKLIYNIGVAPFTEEKVSDGKWITVQGDLYPHILRGLKEAWKRGALTESKNINDYYIGAMNMGWEVSGLNNVAMGIKNFSINARA